MSNDWVVEAVIQFVKSPLWAVPINNFIDDQCIVFADDDEEMKFEYTSIFQHFQKLVDSLLTSFIEELGVPAEEVLAACKARMVTEQTSPKSQRFVTEFIEYITCLDDFRSFKKLMEQRNVTLELEAAKALQNSVAARQAAAAQQQPTAPVEVTAQPVESDEERDLRLAIEASLAEDEVKKREMQLEDTELQKALALSVAMEEERVRAQQAYLEECAKRTAQREEALRIQHEQAKLEEERQRKIRELEAATLQQRVANIVEKATAPPPSVDDVPSPAASTPIAVHQPAPVPVVAQPLPDVVRISSTVVEAPSGSDLAPLGGRKAAFTSFRALPSLPGIPSTTAQPKFNDLRNEILSTTPKPSSMPTPAQIVVNKQEPTKEQIEERTRQMREQRERLAAVKKQERAVELENFKNAVSPAVPSAQSSQGTPEEETRKLTVEIARRFRDDLLGESRKQ